MAITQRLQFGKPLPIVNKEKKSKKQTCFYDLPGVVLQFKS